MAEELKACPFCGGAVRFHSDEDCHGCHYIECSGCKAMFDFSPTTDPENQCDSLHELQCGIARTWNTRAKASQGGVAVAAPTPAPTVEPSHSDVSAALDWLDDFVARCNGDDRGSCESVNIVRRALLNGGQV